jgi:hypothetical protein
MEIEPMTKAKTSTPEDQAPAVETTTAAAVPATEAPPVEPGADATAGDTATDPAAAEAEAAAAAEAEAKAEAVAALGEVFEAKHIENLNHLAQTIHMLNTTGHRLGLVDELQNLWGAEIVESDGDGVTIAMQGITTEPSDSLDTALTNWANAARRTIAAAAA